MFTIHIVSNIAFLFKSSVIVYIELGEYNVFLHDTIGSSGPNSFQYLSGKAARLLNAM